MGDEDDDLKRATKPDTNLAIIVSYNLGWDLPKSIELLHKMEENSFAL